MAIDRVFMDWDRPLLPRAARWLCEHVGGRRGGESESARQSMGAGPVDLSEVLVVVPGGRARRRLLELLVEAAGDGGVMPPQLITVGHLPEALCEPANPLGDDLLKLLATLEVLRSMPAEVLEPLLPHPPEPDDLAGWIAVAEEIRQLEQDLAGEGLRLGQMPERLRAIEGFGEIERWQMLARLHEEVLMWLQRLGVDDPTEAHLAAIEQGSCHSDRPVVLIGTADMPQLHRQMLRNVDATVTALIHAPDHAADHFDEVGCLRVEHWCRQPIELEERHVHVVDGPRDQIMQVLRLMLGDEVQAEGRQQEAGSEGLIDRYQPDEVTIGLGDESLGPPLERALEMAGVPSRLAAGRRVEQSRPARLLEGLAEYLRGQRRDAFAALLRHPDIERYLDRVVPVAEGDEGARFTAWQTLLDNYISDHLPLRIDGRWLGGERRWASQLAAARETVLKLLPDEVRNAASPGTVKRPLHEWCGAIVAILEAVYPGEVRTQGPEDERILARALQVLGDTLRTLNAARGWEDLSPRMTLAEAITLTLHQAGGSSIPPAAGDAVVEMLGWLELALDDAPATVVSGVNEGAIPSSRNADLFLPDRVRSELGLVDNRRRLARDAFALRTMLESRDRLVLISARRDRDGDPLVPSRLLLMQPPQALAPWVRHFYGSEEAEAQRPLVVLKPGDVSQIAVPPPQPPDEPLARLSVTAFRDYLACPYRFYLRHVEGLESMDDSAVEMDGAAFGSLAHGVLAGFSDSSLPNALDVEAVSTFLSEQLDALCERQFGRELSPALWVQREQLRHRLDAFARWHVRALEQGWEVLATERSIETVIEVDGEPFTISGQIDRIDRHPEGRVRIIDYKTSDSAIKPEQAHRRRSDDGYTWVDLQLPLYTLLARQLAVVSDAAELELGYVNLPKNLDEIDFYPAPWEPVDIEAAIETAHHVIRCIRRGEFWPPGEPPPFADDLSAICLDGCPVSSGGER